LQLIEHHFPNSKSSTPLNAFLMLFSDLEWWANQRARLRTMFREEVKSQPIRFFGRTNEAETGTIFPHMLYRMPQYITLPEGFPKSWNGRVGEEFGLVVPGLCYRCLMEIGIPKKVGI
jgi:hypothetical protein